VSGSVARCCAQTGVYARRVNGAAAGRDWGISRHHFDIGAVSVFAKFVI
jgi:hypothetical protein